MERKLINEILNENYLEKEVLLKGWVHRIRGSSKRYFIVLRDSSNIIQCVVEKSVNEKAFEVAEKISIESSIEVKGKVIEDKRSPIGYEIHVSDLRLIGLAETFPITKDQSVEFLLDKRHLWLRSRRMRAIMRIRAGIIRFAREWFNKNQFVEVSTPMLITAACEGGATLFNLKYFDSEAYLTQSSQLYLEALIYSLGKVYVIAPSFRAEKSRTVRHLAEFWHLESEQPFCDNFQNMKYQEGLITYICKRAKEQYEKEFKFLKRDPKVLDIEPPFPRLKYDEAIEILHEKGVKIDWGEDLGTEEERVLTIDRRMPIFVYNYPKDLKGFYHKPDENDDRIVNCADLLAPEGHGEIIGGGQRIHDKQELIKRIKEENLNPNDYEWYIDLRRYGTVPHSGFGLGIERIIKWICGLEHIRDAITFPRTINRVYP
ncbi:MAG: asparagine--tRNA ligase [Candidatus Lokiarchaeota archaeon]|nr:asparagine--tRNA ligase [Candidatus Lokiarchaeota archaeon]